MDVIRGSLARLWHVSFAPIAATPDALSVQDHERTHALQQNRCVPRPSEAKSRHRLNRGRRCRPQIRAARGGRRLYKVREDILKLCRETLPRHKVPVAISFVPALKVATTGKLLRRNE
jgi:acyl-CoA synthetase (AMP-forming)/AMP-acid ligase II